VTNFVAVYDACVLYPAPLRDLLIRLARTGLFRARWTDQIHNEWIRSVHANRPDLSLDLLHRTKTLMNESVLDCLVTGYEGLANSVTLPDDGDRHVLAAAIRCQAGTIVTFNLKDFPREVLRPYGIEAQHPDDFISHQFDLSQVAVCSAVKEQRESLKNPPRTIEELLDTFLSLGLTTSVESLRRMQQLL
jgi:hypothetical protein